MARRKQRPCPWCGSDDPEDVAPVEQDDFLEGFQWSMWCSNCAVAGPHAGTPDEARERWNNRHEEQHGSK